MQIGRWLAERRHLCGWPSQRALVDAAGEHLLLADTDISEAFIARLEAGHLVHPYRGSVRSRVLLLAWLLCKTPRDIRVYQRVTGLMELKSDESVLVERLRQRLGLPQLAPPRVLPARPRRFVGRATELATAMRVLGAPASGVLSLTGLPGVGKTALASEVAHRFGGQVPDGVAAFADGIIWMDVAGVSGEAGVPALLEQIAGYLGPPSAERTGVGSGVVHSEQEAQRLESAVQCVRQALDSREVLLVLDRAEDNFPLREVLDALMPRERSARATATGGDRGYTRRGILIISRYVPPPSLISHRVHLGPLGPEEAIELFATLVRHTLTDAEREHVALICAALGNLPLAIEVAATAVVARGIPLDLLAAQVNGQPLDVLLDHDGDLRAIFAQALEALQPPARERLAFLGVLGAPAFGIEWAASLRPRAGSDAALSAPDAAPTRALAKRQAPFEPPNDQDGAEPSPLVIPHAEIARTANELGQLVRHSLLEVTAGSALAEHGVGAGTSASVVRYQLHPLVAAFAGDYLMQTHAEFAEEVTRNARMFALAYVERHQADMPALEREREMLLAVLNRAWQDQDDETVVRIVRGLWRLIGRLGSYALSARVLYWGVVSSQRIDDRYQQARFLNRLGSLCHYHGETPRARQAWEASLDLAETLRRPADVWQPLASLAMLACESGDMERARRLVETYLRRGQEEDALSSVARALFNRGVGAHLEGDEDRAFADLIACTRLLALRGVSDQPAQDGVLQLATQAELARVQGDFARARLHTDLAVSLAEEVSDLYTVADLLLEQARFARKHQHSDEARTLATRAVEAASRIEAHQLHQQGLNLLYQLPAAGETVQA